ncbi:MAG: DUF2752 domain-containing protein [Verrucomicrobiota bacterium]
MKIRPNISRLRIIVFSSVALGIVALAALLYTVNPTQCALYPPCFFHKLTGLYCPGCGSTRALHQLLHGNLADALHFNPLAVLALPVLGYLVVRRSASQVRPVWVRVAFAIILTFGVVRNIPGYPFTALVP